MPTYEIAGPRGDIIELQSETDPTPEMIEAAVGVSAPPDASPKGQWQKAGPLERAKMLVTGYAEHSVKPFDEAQQPSIHLPRIETKNEGIGGAAAGVVNATEGFVEGLSAPANAPLMATGAVLSPLKASVPLARRVLAGMAGYFGVEMGKGAVEQAKSAKSVIEDPNATTAQKAEAVAAPILTGAGGALAALGTAFELAPDAHVLAEKLQGKSPKQAADILREESANAETPEQAAALGHSSDELLRTYLKAENEARVKANEVPPKRAADSAEVFQGGSETGIPGVSVGKESSTSPAKGDVAPTVEDGSLPDTPDLSLQAQRMYDEYGGVDPVLLGRLASTAGGAAYGMSTGEDGSDKLKRAVEFGALGYLIGKFGPRVVKNGVETVTGIGANLDAIKRTIAGESAPRTTAASEESGNAIVRYASAPIAAKLDAAFRSGQVLADKAKDPAFSKKLGAVLVEDRLQAIRQGFLDAGMTAEANSVSSIIGLADSPFATDAEYRAALEDPEIKAAIGRHKEIVQPMSEAMHLKTGGQLARPGLNTDAFVNLKAILGEEGANAAVPEVTKGARQGDLTNPMQRRTRFGRSAEGTADRYELDYDTIARRMIEANYEEAAKRDMYAQLEADGLGAEVPLGQPGPDFGGAGAVKLPLESRGRGEAPRNFYVRSDIAKEVTNALDTRSTLVGETAAKAARGLNLIQLSGPTDPVFHTANIVSSLANVPSTGNVLKQVAAKIPGVNVAGALYRLAKASQERTANSPEVQQQIVDLARIGALRPEHTGLISALDKTARVALDNAFDDLVQAGLAKDSEHARREFVNQIGQYNPRLQGTLGRMAKELGVSPFIVAGKTFNRNALRAVAGAPGVETTGPAATARLWATNMAGLVTGVVVLPAVVNYLINGKVAGRDGTPIGAIDTGKDDDQGKHITIDPQRWTNVRRGMRITGLSAVMEGLKNDKDGDRIGGEAIRDILWGQVHPWIGPFPTAVTIAETGYSPSGFKEAKQLNPAAKFPTMSQKAQNLKAAFEETYPVFGAASKAGEHGIDPITGVAQSLAGAIGVRNVTDYSPQQARAETAMEAAKRATVERMDEAQQEYRKLSGLKPTDRREPLMRIRAKDPLLFDKVINEFEYQTKGLTPAQRVAARLGVEDGSRARYIAAELKQMETPAAKKDYLTGLIKTDVLTDDVADQVADLMSAQKPGKN